VPGLYRAAGSPVTVFSSKAREALAGLPGRTVRFPEIETKIGVYQVVNVHAVIDCLDKRNSKFVTYVFKSVVEENKLKGAVFEKLGEAIWILRYIPRPLRPPGARRHESRNESRFCNLPTELVL
jgi:hypothetical protein